jgi:hypothetical protein
MNQEVIEFYNQNKNFSYSPPEVPSNVKNNSMEFSRWLLNHPNFAWIELDIDLDLETWKKESSAAVDYFVDHRASTSIGWRSCCIHGLGIEKTLNWPSYLDDETLVKYDWTPLSDITPTIKDFWVNQFPAESYQRIRFMLIEPEGYISPHSDAPGRLPGETIEHDTLVGWPINLAIIHPEDCHMVLEGYGVVPFTEGKLILINIRHRHAFLNFSNKNRIHMIAASIFGSKVKDMAKLVHRSFFKNE